MKAPASGLWHAEKTRNRADLCEVAGASTSEPAVASSSKLEANAVRTAPKGRRTSKFQEFAKTFTQ